MVYILFGMLDPWDSRLDPSPCPIIEATGVNFRSESTAHRASMSRRRYRKEPPNENGKLVSLSQKSWIYGG